MDEFAKNYFQQLNTLATNFATKRHALAKSRIKLFAAALTRQLNNNHHYDVIICSGNSGMIMGKLTEFVYTSLEIPLPPLLHLPIYRFKPDNTTYEDNSFLIPFIQKYFSSEQTTIEVLFVDDEIMKGITAHATFQLLLQAYPTIRHITATIIAENHFFEWHYFLPTVSVAFFGYAPLIQGLNDNIGHIIPEAFHHEIQEALRIHLSPGDSAAIVTSGKLKQRDEHGQGYFTDTVEEILVKKISAYQKQKHELLSTLRDLVKEGIEDYTAKTLQFRF